MRIYVTRSPEALRHLPVPEIEAGLPVHPADLPARVLALLERGEDFLTASDIVLSIVGRVVRTTGCRHTPLEILVEGRALRMAADGGTLEPWPEEGEGSVLEAGFYHRFAGDQLGGTSPPYRAS